jgi:hypothetical protein
MTRESKLTQKLLSGKAGDAFRDMPPLHHRLPDEEYKTSKSEVYDWIREQEDIMHWLMMKAHKAGAIKYDPVLEMWHGSKYFEEESDAK